MSSFNKSILIGNLTKDPELKFTTGGTPVTTLRLAVTSKFKQGDETKDETLFIDCPVFGKQAENCNQYLSKGSSVLVEGRLRERKWEQDGMPKSKFEVVASNIRFMPKSNGSKQSSESNSTDSSQGTSDHSEVEPF